MSFLGLALNFVSTFFVYISSLLAFVRFPFLFCFEKGNLKYAIAKTLALHKNSSQGYGDARPVGGMSVEHTSCLLLKNQENKMCFIVFYLVWYLCHFSIIVDKFREKFHTEAVIGNHVHRCHVILVPRAGYVTGSADIRIN